MIGRGALILFVGIAALSIALVAWWIFFLLRVGGERWVFMLATEGSFFIAVLLVGVFLMYRTLVEQVRLQQMRATFFSAVTHELKTPIAAIRLFLETIGEDRVDAEKRKDLVRKMIMDCDRLDRLVADLLRAGQIEAGALAPERKAVDLSVLCEEAVAAARARLAPGDEIDFFEHPLKVAGDWELLRSVVQNLLDNAIKYTKPPRRVAVRLDTAPPGGVELVVRDNGIGMNPGTLARAFEPFHRAGDEEAREQPGTGLGLYLVQGIILAHGGHCRVESAGPGRGTTVRCWLPERDSTGEEAPPDLSHLPGGAESA